MWKKTINALLQSRQEVHYTLSIQQFLRLGYQKLDNQSEKAKKFLKWYALKLDVEIDTGESSPDGEVRMRDKMTGHTYRVDGFIPKDRAGTDRDVVIEYLGCAYHGTFP